MPYRPERASDFAQNLSSLADLVGSVGGIVDSATQRSIDRSRIQSEEARGLAAIELQGLNQQLRYASQQEERATNQLNELTKQYGDIVDFSALNKSRSRAMSKSAMKIQDSTQRGLEIEIGRSEQNVEGYRAATGILNEQISSIYQDVATYQKVQDVELGLIGERFRESGEDVGDKYSFTEDEVAAMKKDPEYKSRMKALGLAGDEKAQGLFLKWMRANVGQKIEFDLQIQQIANAKRQAKVDEANIAMQEGAVKLQDLQIMTIGADAAKGQYDDALAAVTYNTQEAVAGIKIGGLTATDVAALPPSDRGKLIDDHTDNFLKTLSGVDKKGRRSIKASPHFKHLVGLVEGAINNQGSVDALKQLDGYIMAIQNRTVGNINVLKDPAAVYAWLEGTAEEYMKSVNVNVKSSTWINRMDQIDKLTRWSDRALAETLLLRQAISDASTIGEKTNPSPNLNDGKVEDVKEMASIVGAEFAASLPQGFQDEVEAGKYDNSEDGWQKYLEDVKQESIGGGSGGYEYQNPVVVEPSTFAPEPTVDISEYSASIQESLNLLSSAELVDFNSYMDEAKRMGRDKLIGLSGAAQKWLDLKPWVRNI